MASTKRIIALGRAVVKPNFTKNLLTGERVWFTINYMNTRVVIVNTAGVLPLLSEPGRFASEARLIECAGADPQRRIQALSAELALSYALSGDELLPPVYSRDEGGRPVIEGGFISLSHTEGFAAAVFSPVPCGIDIEAYRPVSEAAARRFLCPAELTAPAEPALARFVIKEAFLKMTGEGVFGGMSRIFETGGFVFRRGVARGRCLRLDGKGYFCRLVTREKVEPEVIFYDGGAV